MPIHWRIDTKNSSVIHTHQLLIPRSTRIVRGIIICSIIGSSQIALSQRLETAIGPGTASRIDKSVDGVSGSTVAFSVDSITQTTAVLRATLSVADFARRLWFEWGQSEFGGISSDPQTIEAYTEDVVNYPLTGLLPQTLYFPKVFVTDTTGADMSSQALRFVTIPRGIHGVTLFPLTVEEVEGFQGYTLWLGVHTDASDCLDEFLGEWSLPPRPPAGAFDLRLVSPDEGNPCFDLGSYLDFRPLYDSAQSDTYHVAFQPGEGGYPLRFSWPNLAKWFSGSLVLSDPFGGMIVRVNMMVESTYVVTNPAIRDLLVISGLEDSSARRLSANTASPLYIRQFSAHLRGTFYLGNDSGTTWFEWGATEAYGSSTPVRLHSGSQSHFGYSELLSGLDPGTNYHFRAVAENRDGLTFGADHSFSTVIAADSSSVIAPLMFSIGSETRTIYLGVHTRATECVDDSLGEGATSDFGIVDARFIDPHQGGVDCYSDGMHLDLRPYYSESQIDTYRIALGDGFGPLVVSWGDFYDYYSGKVLMNFYYSHDIIRTYELAHPRSRLIPKGTSVEIIAEGPILQFGRPTISRYSIQFLSDSSIKIGGWINPYGQSTDYWLEYGANTEYGYTSPERSLPESIGAIQIEPVELKNLEPWVSYHFRLCASNLNGITHGNDHTFTISPDTSADSSNPAEFLADGSIPSKPYLYQNFPNPFNPVTKVVFDIDRDGPVVLKIFDVSGREVATLVDKIMPAGRFSVDWTPGGASSGIYLYRIQTIDFTGVKKMLHVK